jgi:large subunit ribosomal protein L25
MANSELSVGKRSVLGKKVAQLRRSGITPANVYGGKVESTSVQADTAALTHLLRASTRNAIINLNIEGEGKPRTVVVRELKRDPVTGQLLHVDFYQVSMTEKMRADVPVVLTGSSEAVSTYGGILLQMVESVAVEALPADIPTQFEVDVSRLTELEQSLHVRDLDIDESKVTLMSDPDVVLARVAAPRVSGTEAEEGAAAPADGEAAAPAAPAPAEGAES